MEHDPDESRALDEWLAFSPEPAVRPSRAHPRLITIIAMVIAVGVVAGIVLLRPTGDAVARSEQQLSALGVPTVFYGATVESVVTAPCDFAPEQECTSVTFLIDDGPDVGSRFVQLFTEGGTTPEFSTGKSVVLSYRPANGVVEGVTAAPCSFDGDLTCDSVEIRLTRGSTAGTVVTYEAPEGFAELFAGQDVDVTFEDSAGSAMVTSASGVTLESKYQWSDFERRPVLIAVVLVFAAAVIALGGWRGVAALAGLGASVAVLLLFVLPAILDGRSPTLVALVGSAAIAYLALYVAHGFSHMTTVALLGTLGALALTTLLAAIVTATASFTGFTSEESSLLTLFPGVDIRGLVLAGMVLGAAGALDDVTVTQASAVWELRATDPNLGRAALTQRGLRIGRDHVASTVNTLLLAYVGAALPLTMLFLIAQQSLGTVANSEVVAVEIVRTLVGSIGLVAAVPLTTWLAARVAASSTPTPSVD